MEPQQTPPDPQRPVAYDANGNPLYAAPQQASQAQSHVTAAPESHEGHNFDPRIRVQYSNEPRVVHSKRELEPKVNQISDALRKKHEDSMRQYPSLNLSDGEYVILSVKRHIIGIVIPIFIIVGLITGLLLALVAYPTVAADQITGEPPENIQLVASIIVLLVILIALGGYATIWIYLKNTFYLTNESVIQEVQQSLFAKHEQTVSLGSIEDASFRQTGLIQTMFNYGTIRLSTEGEETTYQFQFVEDPKQQIAIINNAIESFKNGRPVEGED